MPSNPLHVLRINARELLRQPGMVRQVQADLDAADLGVQDDRVTGTVGVALEAVSSIDGVVVTGSISTPWRASCRRCLTEVAGTARIAVDEVYQDDVGEADAFQLVGDQIDMAPAVREYVMLEIPDGPLCRDDCAGICPICGIDRNQAGCECDTTVSDDRWAPLDGLRLDDD